MKIQTKRIMEIVVPGKLIFKNQMHHITNISKKFIIRDYKIKTVDGKIDTVILNNPHPNADPRSGEFCIPPQIREWEVNKKSLNFIRMMMYCFNLDDCYFTPWDEIEYKKI